MRENRNIVLIGMPGSGKTHIGRRMASLMGRVFVDTDEEIERNTGMTIPEFFVTYGEAEFRKLEAAEIAKWGGAEKLVISTGGGMVLDRNNYPAMRENGRVYFIRRSLDKLSTEGRPLSHGGLGTIEEMYAKRLPRYMELMDAEIENDDPDKAADMIICNFRSWIQTE